MSKHWRPLPNSTQAVAIDTRADQTFFCGTRGCGKTAAQLMLFRKMAEEHDESCVGIILDTEYKALDNIVAQAHKFYGGAGRFSSHKADYFWLFPSGARLLFRTARTEDACKGYLGHEYAFIGFNELSKWPSPTVYNTMMGSLRTASKDIRSKVFSTSNPFGVGKLWLKRKFINPVPYGVLQKQQVKIPLPEGKSLIETKTLIALRGNYLENPFFTPADIANLLQGCEDNPEKYAAWVLCDWDAAGCDGAISDLWKADVHIIPNFPIPHAWRIDRCLDWGSSDPFSVGWFAVANGEEVSYNGHKINIPRGSVIQFAEWYGCSRDSEGKMEIGKNQGLKIPPREVAEGILSREETWKNMGVYSGKVYPGAADTNISAVYRRDVESIEKTMQQHGVFWRKADKGKGSRANGLQAIRNRLNNALKGRENGYYVMRRCQASIETLPFIEREGEDILSDQEDHIYDMTRYRLMERHAVNKFNVSYPLGGRYSA